MKLALCLLIVVISAYIGRLMSKRLVQRLDFFRDYLSAMTQLSDKVVGVGLDYAGRFRNAAEIWRVRCCAHGEVEGKTPDEVGRHLGAEHCHAEMALPFSARRTLNF